MNKRGQGLSTTAIILIVLGVLILVFLIIGFAIGWGKIFPWISPPNNVDDIAEKCQLACTTQGKYDYCSSVRDVKVENDFKVGAKNLGKKFDANCYELANFALTLGIQKCSSIDCGKFDEAGKVYSSEAFAIAACNAEKDKLGPDPNSAEYVKGIEILNKQNLTYQVGETISIQPCVNLLLP